MRVAPDKVASPAEVLYKDNVPAPVVVSNIVLLAAEDEFAVFVITIVSPVACAPLR